MRNTHPGRSSALYLSCVWSAVHSHGKWTRVTYTSEQTIEYPISVIVGDVVSNPVFEVVAFLASYHCCHVTLENSFFGGHSGAFREHVLDYRGGVIS